MAVSFTRTDLDRLLQMLIDSEAGIQPVNPHLAFGFRELAGTNNNLVPGQSTFGSADQTFPRLTAPVFQTVTVNVDGTPFDPNPGTAGDTLTTTYASTVPGSPSQFGVNVVDPAPRVISNLISDLSSNNPAAVAAAQAFGAQLGDGYTAFNTNPAGTWLPGAPPADPNNLFIGNITPDAGLSAPFNNWMTFFGQFFDHGLDMISKGGNGYVYIPLQPGDPLYVEGSPTNFMILTRATDLPGPDGKLGTADDIHQNLNQTSPFVDQNQTYASDGSHNAFLREYMIGVDGKLHSTGKMLQHESAGADGILRDDLGTAVNETADNTFSGMATWGDLKQNALKFGLTLLDTNVGNVPLLATDAYGNLILGPNGHVQVIVNVAGTAVQYELDPAAPKSLADINAATGGTVLFTGHAFIDDMARQASPFSQSGAALTADADDVATPNGVPAAGFYDNELLDAHYVAGDGRVNENIALTTVHAIFHDEHNRLVDQTKALIQAQLDAGDTAFASAWVLPGTVLTPGTQIADNQWNGERLMQVAKFGTETQYQHLVFEEFARKIAPTIHLFGNVDIHLDPAITSEFANAVYRFGHSMLDENVPLYQLNADGTMAIGVDGKPILTDMGLIQAFTNPLAFAALGDTGAAQIIQGTTHQIGSEIDEFVTGSLRNNLLGLPLDLAALNIARGRDTGVAPLNLVRAQIYDATHDQTLKPYDNWAEFGQYLKHAESLVNFVAAYGTHTSITGTSDLAAKRLHAAQLISWGLDPASASGDADHVDAYNFMHSLGQYANAVHGVGGDGQLHTSDDTFTTGGLDNPVAVHGAWSTGNVTGVDNIDLWIGGLAEKQNLFGGLLGSTFNFIFETQLERLQDGDRLYYLPRIEGFDFGNQIENNSFADMIIANTGAKHISASIFLTPEYTVEARDYFLKNPDGSFVLDGDGHRIATDSSTWLRNPVTGALLVEVLPDGTVRFIGDDNFFGNTMVLGGTAGDDRLQAGHADDDTVWGDAGNDWIDGGNGDDFLYGGTGDDTIVDSAGADVIHGEDGNDTVFAGIGDDIIFGNDGNDYIDGGAGIDEVSGGAGNDIIKGGEDDDELVGNEGDDWIEGGDGGDILVGDTGAPTGMVPLFAANDVLIGGTNGDKMVGFSGDDIMLGLGGFDKFNGLLGFDWASFEEEVRGVSVDMERREFVANPLAPAGDAIRDFFVETEAASGTRFDDFIQGTEDAGRAAGVFNELQNVDLIFNLRTFFVGGVAAEWDATGQPILNGTGFDNGNILLGGDGNDVITGRSGNDIIDGDAYLHVELSGTGGAGSEIIREIRWDTTDGDIDTAVFRDVLANYTINLTPDENGFITVTHNGTVGGVVAGVRIPVNEGTDKIRNVERLQFADVILNINPDPNANLPTTGSLVITDDDANATTPVNAFVGTALTVDLLASNVGDPDGIQAGTIKYQWQQQIITAGGGQAWVDIVGATGTTFTPGNVNLGNPIRVVESYVDGKGWKESIASVPTALVLTNPTPVVNTAPFVVGQQGQIGLADTAARVGFPVNVFLPLTTAFGDNETAPGALNFVATLANGAALSTVGLTFTLNFDAAGLVTGATITGVVTNPGAIDIKVTATDGGPGTPLSVTDVFRINVQTGNLAPVPTADAAFAGQEHTTLVAQLSAGTDIDGPNPLKFNLVPNSATNGTVFLAGNGKFVFKPTPDFVGTATFKYTLTDGLMSSVQQTVTIDVTAVNDGDAPLTITGVAAAGGTLSALIGVDPDGPWTNASYQWYRDGAAISGATGADLLLATTDIGHTFSVEATYEDGQGFVTTVGQVSLANAVGALTLVGQSGATPTINVTNTVTDPDGPSIFDIYNWQVSPDGTPGSFIPVDPSQLSLDGTSFLPAATGPGGAYVQLTLTYVDGAGNFNDVVTEVIHYVVDGDTGNVIVGIGEDDIIFAQGGNDDITGGLCTDFVDAGDGDDTIRATAGDGNDVYNGGAGLDTLVLTGNQADYTVTQNVDGSIDIVDHRAVDSNGTDHLTSIELLQFADVLVPTVDPVAQADAYSIGEDNVLTVSNPANGVLANDVFVLPLNAQIVTGPQHGNLTLNPNGTFTYTPNSNYAGADSFTYTASNGTTTSQPATVSITVNPQNDGALSVSINGSPQQGNTLNAVVGNDPDGAGSALQYQWLRNGQVIANATGTAYNLVAADIGAQISVRVSYTDGQGFAEAPVSAQTAVVTGTVGQTINGTNGNNTLIGTAGGDNINGLGGNDQITGGAGNDVANGGDGNDTFFATVGDGNDIYNGGAGTDTYNMLNTAAPSDVNLALQSAKSSETGVDQLISIENVVGSAGDNIIIGDAAANRLQGNGGNDTLDGGSLGADILRGGTGNDLYIVSHTGMTLTELANEGTDTVQSAITFALGGNFENLTLTGTGNINGTGNGLANVIIGNAGNNLLNGGAGNDTFVATVNDGNDTYQGGSGRDTLDLSKTSAGATVNLAAGTASSTEIGSDTLSSIENVIGSSGDDIFIGGNPPESFTGGLGADTFTFLTRQAAGNGATRSLITDFLSGTDHISLSAIDADSRGAAPGLQHLTFAGAAATGTLGFGQVGYHYIIDANGQEHTIIEANIRTANADPSAVDMQIDLLGHVALTGSDFFL